MSLRRKSCDPCYKGRRKCDLTYPVCKRCQANQKSCHYVTLPPTTPQDAIYEDNSSGPYWPGVATTSLDFVSCSGQTCPLVQESWNLGASNFDFNLSHNLLLEEMLQPSVPNLIGELGELQPITGTTKTLEWVIEQYKSYPRAFAQFGETTFVHKSLHSEPPLRSIRSAFGICAAYLGVTEQNKSIFFRVLDAEVSALIQTDSDVSLSEELSSMQALMLYQIIRLFDGDLQHRKTVEQQANLLRIRALRLLRRAETELHVPQPSWEGWTLVEGIRRTVLLVFMVHGLQSVLSHGICPEIQTIGALPVCTEPGFWNSQDGYLEHRDHSGTMKYFDFTTLWLASPPRKLEPFEKFLLVSCKGFEQVEARSSD